MLPREGASNTLPHSTAQGVGGRDPPDRMSGSQLSARQLLANQGSSRVREQQRASRPGFTYPAEPPTAPGSVLGAEGGVGNRRWKGSWAHELSGAHRRDTGQGALAALEQRLGGRSWTLVGGALSMD